MAMRRVRLANGAELALGLLASFTIAGIGGGTSTYQAAFDRHLGTDVSAELQVDDGHATLVVADGLPEPAGVCQVSLVRPGSDAPKPRGLFLPRGGRVTAAAPGTGDTAAVTPEPEPGSEQPTSDPIITTPLS
jgi:hypothetical protein